MKIHHPAIHSIKACLIVAGALALSAAWAQSTPQNLDNCTPQFMKEVQSKADQGNAQAQEVLGAAYYGGKCIPINKALAMKWFRRSIEEETKNNEKINGGTLLILSSMYLKGESVPPNLVVAYALLTMAVEFIRENNPDSEDYQRSSNVLAQLTKGLSPSQKKEGMDVIKQMGEENNIFAPIDRYLGK